MRNKIAASFLVAVFIAVALLSAASSVIDSAAATLSSYSNEELEHYHEIVKEGEGSILNCVLIIGCLIIGFLLGRIGSNVCDGTLVLGNNPGQHYIDLDISDETLPDCRFIMLKVVKKENE